VNNILSTETLVEDEDRTYYWVPCLFLCLIAALTCDYRCSPGGIGHDLALELRQRGLRVFASGRTLERISDLKEAGIECITLTVDDPKSVAACHEEMVGLLNGEGLDYLFNNAGMGLYRRTLSASGPGSDMAW
jgi:NAD(P)-dependent dehydrogenase (short-subunit alcohol dehydrogenase family)